ncbi:MAG: hypothetical protein KC619_13205 [Myxococcales bacterium]|nr:hypothetical protein [Myxococcales bacterium]
MMRTAASLSLMALLFGASAAYAQEDGAEGEGAPIEPADQSAAREGAQERARIHFRAGASYYEAGAYEDALR